MLRCGVEVEVAARGAPPRGHARASPLVVERRVWRRRAESSARGDPRVEAVILLDSLYAGYIDAARARSTAPASRPS